MSRVTRTLTLTVLLSLALGGCRDEQAGPKNRKPRAVPPVAAPAATGQVLDAVPSDLTYRSNASWLGGAVRYLGTRVQPQNARPGERIRLTHYFQATQPPPQGWSLFMHLVDSSGGMLANLDHEVQGGAMPLERWPVGKIVIDEHELPAPQTPARIVLGFWQGDRRLPVDQPQMHDGASRVLGPTLGGAQAENLPEYRARKTPRPPTIDGDLSDPAWQDAAEVELGGSFDGRKPQLRTTARVLYDDAHLYVAFDSEDPDVWGTLMNRDDPIYTQEVVEVFLDANADGRTYNELQVSPNNVIFDAYFPARRQGMDTSWDSKMQTAVKIRGTLNDNSDRDQGWSAEMKIPYATLSTVPNVPPKAGDKWRMNLYRLELPDRRSQQGQSFSPLFMGDFHHLPRFGWLVFD